MRRPAGSHRRAFSFLAGPVNARPACRGPSRASWFDPTSAAYTEIGTGLPNTGTRVFTPPGNNSTGEGDWVLLIATPAPTPEGHQAVLVFGVDDVDTTYRDLVARGATALAEPQDRLAWRARTALLRAHDGYLVEIYSPLREANAPNA